MVKSNYFEIAFLRRIANTEACSFKWGIVRDFYLIIARWDFHNKKLETCFLEYSEKYFTYATAPETSEEASQNILTQSGWGRE